MMQIGRVAERLLHGSGVAAGPICGLQQQLRQMSAFEHLDRNSERGTQTDWSSV
jgi:hypothetical protein